MARYALYMRRKRWICIETCEEAWLQADNAYAVKWHRECAQQHCTVIFIQDLARHANDLPHFKAVIADRHSLPNYTD